jgi:hypothetical protein
LTPREALNQAFAWLGSWGININSTPESVLFGRMSFRQAELFGWANSIDREYFGKSAVLPLSNGEANLATIADLGVVQVLTIQDRGTSSLISGERVRIVRADDTRDLRPRATLRNRIIRGVGNDLAGVASLNVFYSQGAPQITVSGAGAIMIPSPFDELLSLDVARFVLARDPATTESAAVAFLTAQEAQRLAAFEVHIRQSYQALESRFG